MSTLHIKNIKEVSLFEWKLENLFVRHTAFQTLDIEFICGKYVLPVKNLVLSYNLIQYINPKFLGCLTLLEHIDLSKNYLEKMGTQNNSILERLLWP